MTTVRGESKVQIAAGLSAAATVALGLVASGRASIWYDESASLSAAQRSVPGLLRLLTHIDLVHGAYYLLLHGWMTLFGSGIVSARALSALGLGLGCYGFVLLVDRVSGSRVALLAGATYAVLPGLSWSATEAREWSLATAAVVWATLALHHALTSGNRRAWIGYACLMVLSIALSVMTILIVLPHLWAARRASRTRTAAVTLIGVTAVMSPFVYFVFTQRNQVAWIRLSTVQVAAQVVANQLFMTAQRRYYTHQYTVGAVLLLTFLALAYVALRARRAGAFAGAVWFVVPTGLLATPALFGYQLYQFRYLTFAAPGACWLIAEGLRISLDATRGRVPRRAVLALGLVPALIAVGWSNVALRDVAAKSGDNYVALADAARGADQVFYQLPSARGIRIAYPRDFAGIDDVLLAATPVDSGTLFGVDKPYESAAPQGDVVAYLLTVHGRKPLKSPLARYLASRGCHLEKERRETRWAAFRYRC